MSMKLVLLRHGESEWNLANRFTGWTDVDLSPRGLNEAKRAMGTRSMWRIHPCSSGRFARFGSRWMSLT